MAKRTFNPQPKFGLHTAEVTYAARKLFNPQEWLILEELFIPGFDRFVDIWAICIGSDNMSKWTKNRVGFKWLSIHAIEVKASRADFVSELKKPIKRAGAIAFSNCYSFAAPRGIIKPEEVPDGLGYIEIQGSKPVIIIRPEYNHVEQPGWDFVAAIGRSLKNG
jgi:hypothetical protein